MSLSVLVAVTGSEEAAIVAGLERAGRDLHVARRCVDLAELLAAASSGLGRVAVVSADLHRLDREAVTRLHRCGVAVIGVADPADAAAWRRLESLDVGTVLPVDVEAPRLAEAVIDAARAFRPGGRGGAQISDPADALAEPPGLAGAAAPAPGRAGAAAPAPGTAGAGAASRSPFGGGRMLAVWGPAGSPGRTTVALSLAGELSHRGRETLLVDADTYAPSLAQSLGLLDESGGIAGAVHSADLGALDVDRLARLSPAVAPALRVLTGLPQASRWPELRPSALEAVWDVARRLARWTVVDCGFCLETDEELAVDTASPRRNGATLAALVEADLVLVVGSADPVGLTRLVRGLTELRDRLGPAARTRVVVTRVRASAVGPDPQLRIAQALRRYADVVDPWLVPDDPVACDEALFSGRMLVEVAPASPARQAFGRIAAELETVLHYDVPVRLAPAARS